MIIIIMLLVLLIAAASYTVFIAPKLEQEVVGYTEAVVMSGDMTVGVVESGYIEYEIHNITYDLDLSVIEEDEEEETEEVIQKYLSIEEVYVAQGEQVEEGAALLKFTEDSVNQVRKLLENALIDANVTYNEAESEYRLAVLEAENSLEIKEVAAKYAENIYNSTNTSIDNEIKSIQLQMENCVSKRTDLEEAVAEARTDYNDALAEYEPIKEYYDIMGVEHIANYLAVQSNYSNAKSALERAESALTQAKERAESNEEQIENLNKQLTQLKAKKEIEKLEANQTYEETLISGENAKYSYDSTVESLAEDLAEAEEEKETYEEKLAAFEALVGEEGILYAPATGKITEVAYSAGDTLERMGTLFSYIEKEGMTVSVDVTQEDIVSLSVGDTVDIEFTAYEGEAYSGTIYSIDTTATSSETPTISYTVLIQVDGTLDKIFGGMSANITFITETREDTLYVSRKAIVEENGNTYVYVKSLLGDKELRQVETGIRNESSVEILSGLEAGEKIYIVTYGEAE